MARTIMPGKRTILVRNVEPVKKYEKRLRLNPKLVYVKIDSDVYLDAVKTSYAIGRCVHHMISDLHLMSLHAMLYNLECAKGMVSALTDKPSKQLAGVQKFIDNTRVKVEERNDMEYPEARSQVITYITEHIMRYEGLGELHGFTEVLPKRK